MEGSLKIPKLQDVGMDPHHWIKDSLKHKVVFQFKMACLSLLPWELQCACHQGGKIKRCIIVHQLTVPAVLGPQQCSHDKNK